MPFGGVVSRAWGTSGRARGGGSDASRGGQIGAPGKRREKRCDGSSSATTRRAGSRARRARRDAGAAMEGARRSRSSIPRPIGIQNEQRRAVERAPLRSTAAWMARARLLWALGATVAARLLKRWPRTPGATRQVAADAETQDILVLCFQKWVLRCGVRRRCGWTAARPFSPSPIHNAGKLPVAGSATSSTRPPHPSFLVP